MVHRILALRHHPATIMVTEDRHPVQVHAMAARVIGIPRRWDCVKGLLCHTFMLAGASGRLLKIISFQNEAKHILFKKNEKLVSTKLYAPFF